MRMFPTIFELSKFLLITERDGKYGRRVKGKDIVRKDVAEFDEKFYHFEYAILEMFMVEIKGTFNNYSMLKLHFFYQYQHFCTIQYSKPHILL